MNRNITLQPTLLKKRSPVGLSQSFQIPSEQQHLPKKIAWWQRILSFTLVFLLLSNPVFAAYAAADESAGELPAEELPQDVADDVSAVVDTTDNLESSSTDSAEAVVDDEINNESQATALVQDSQESATGTVRVIDKVIIVPAATSSDETGIDTEAAAASTSVETIASTTASTTSETNEGTLDDVSSENNNDSASSSPDVFEDTPTSTTDEVTSTTNATTGDDNSTGTTTDKVASSTESTTGSTTEETVLEYDADEVTSHDQISIANESVSQDTQDIALDVVASSTTATDTTPIAEIVIEEVNDENRYVFGKHECIKVEEGEFYCIEVGIASSTDATSAELEYNVYSAIDSEGDKEIYFKRGDIETQVTNNFYDDDKPYYDQGSGLIVWQELVADRYQIFSYNTITGETRQITGTSFNNTNPYVYGNRIVWQGWVDTNWEIFTLKLELNTRDIEQITSNTWNDMFPQVYESLITWQAFVDGKWQVFVYNLQDGSTKKVGESDGQYENPRFMLVIDNKKENGDVALIGYDTTTGEVAPLGTTPAPQPQGVPESPVQDQGQAVPPEAGSTVVKTRSDVGAGGDGNGDGSGDGNDGPQPTASSTDPVVTASSTSSVISSVPSPASSTPTTVASSTPLVLSQKTASTTSPILNLEQVASTTNPIASSSPAQIVLTKPVATSSAPVIAPVILSSSASSTNARTTGMAN